MPPTPIRPPAPPAYELEDLSPCLRRIKIEGGYLYIYRDALMAFVPA